MIFPEVLESALLQALAHRMNKDGAMMDTVIKRFKSRQFFTTWFGVGIPPFLLGTVYSAYLISLSWGITTTVIVAFWTYQTFQTTCRRCQYYNTTKCGLPGIIVPYLYKKESPFSISLKRIKVHYYFDLALIIYVNFIYAHFPAIYPVVGIGSVVGYLIVFRNKRFHGLLWRLKEEDTPKVTKAVKIPIYKIERAQVNGDSRVNSFAGAKTVHIPFPPSQAHKTPH